MAAGWPAYRPAPLRYRPDLGCSGGRARLCQFTDQLEEAWLPAGAWAAYADATRPLPDGADVVLGFDGSFSGDCTALVAVTVAERPHVELVELWEPAGGQVPMSTSRRRRSTAG